MFSEKGGKLVGSVAAIVGLTFFAEHLLPNENHLILHNFDHTHEEPYAGLKVSRVTRVTSTATASDNWSVIVKML